MRATDTALGEGCLPVLRATYGGQVPVAGRDFSNMACAGLFLLWNSLQSQWLASAWPCVERGRPTTEGSSAIRHGIPLLPAAALPCGMYTWKTAVVVCSRGPKQPGQTQPLQFATHVP